MARRVFLHIGLPKTGTSYLQTILWSHRPQLREAGLLVPGRERRDHLWSSLIVRGDPRVRRRTARAADAWSRVLRDIAAWDGDAVVSHEFFCSASEEQAARTVADLAPAEVHLVVTAREPLGLFTSSWQESLKNKSTTRLEDYGTTVSKNPRVVWNWRALDLGLVLQRWTPELSPEHVHVITAPPSDAPRDELWSRFCQVVGVDPQAMATDVGFSNTSMGVVEAETLRRINEHLDGFDRAFDRGVWIRSFLADERLVPRGGERFWPGPEQQEDCRRRGAAAVDYIRERGFHVVGELDSLLVPEPLPPRRHPSSVTDAEVAEVAVELAARLLSDVKNRVAGPATSQRLRRSAPEKNPGFPERAVGLARRWLRRR
jgi:hypothetical protein